MIASYVDCAEKVARLHRAVLTLERASALLQLDPLKGREWFELLNRKLLPQLTDDAFLVVAVVGGTNIGKSVIFNHLAGSRASGTSPLASGTKHPVCLVPPGFAEEHDLNAIFEGFAVTEWRDAEEPLREDETDRLYWHASDRMPDNLLVLDTPDIDSDARVNWGRADNIRRCADVLIAVLTQQKYNDAAVKQFFRKAAEEDKAVIVLFNQCLLPEDEEYWPQWLGTFCRETGVQPEFVYLAPNDRRAAEENRLAFFERPFGGDGLQPATDVEPGDPSTPRSLNDDLSQLRFGEIKVRTLLGSLKHLLSSEYGVPRYLQEVAQRSEEFQGAARSLTEHNLAKIDKWPAVPNSVLVGEVRRWWQLQREGWPAKVHSFYNTLGNGLIWPFQFAREKFAGPQTPPLEEYRKREWETIVDAVEKVYRKLQELSELGDVLLKPRLQHLLAGTSRTALIERLKSEHAKVDLQRQVKQVVAQEMQTFHHDSPQLYRFLKRVDSAAAVARPATSIAFFVTGFGPAGDAAAHLAVDSAIQSVVHVVGDVAGGTVSATIGETAVSRTTAAGMGTVEAKFRKLHAVFNARRGTWLAGMLKDHLLGRLPEDLKTSAEMPRSPEFQEVVAALDALSQQLRTHVGDDDE